MSKMTFEEFKRKVDFKGQLEHIDADDLCGEEDWARRVVYNILFPTLPDKREFPEALVFVVFDKWMSRHPGLIELNDIEIKSAINDLRRIWETYGGDKNYCEHCNFGYNGSAQKCDYCQGTGDRRQRPEEGRRHAD